MIHSDAPTGSDWLALCLGDYARQTNISIDMAQTQCVLQLQKENKENEMHI